MDKYPHTHQQQDIKVDDGMNHQKLVRLEFVNFDSKIHFRLEIS